jgi:two-component system, LytTR family, response regulator LytT
MKALIIEDEPHARAELKRLLKKLVPDWTIAAELDSVADACTFLATGPSFDIVFADIQLSDGLSFDIFSQIRVQQPVIFTTAYNEFAIKAFELNSIDYLLKPIEEKQLNKAIQKLEQVQRNYSTQSTALTADKLKLLLTPKQPYKSRFLIKMGDQYKYITTDQIAYIEAVDNAVYAVIDSQQKLLLDYKMEDLEKQLDPQLFFRINRGFIVQIAAIRKVHKYFNSRLRLELDPPVEEPVLVSRLKVDDFLKWMDQ